MTQPTTAITEKSYQHLDLGCRIVVGVAFAALAYRAGLGLDETFKLSTVLVIVKAGLDTILYVTRKHAKVVELNVYLFSITFFGTMSGLAVIPSANSPDHLAANIVQSFAIAVQIAAILSLNRSFGLLPANRGIKTGGMYRIVRHPLYASYTVGYLAWLANNFTMENTLIITFAVVCEVLRLFAEEKLLLRGPGVP